MKREAGRLLSCVVLSAFVACGGDDLAPPVPTPDASTADAGPSDAARDANPVTVDAAGCPDEDGDGHGAASCGDDCDDTDAARYPDATEVCDSDDEDCVPTTFGVDADGDGFESSACCNGVDNCGLDCDDTLNTVNPGASEVCNAGVDDDCDGLGDAAEGVCTACPVGFEGMGTDCTDIDECATGGYCGSGATSCTNSAGSFACTCGPGYSAASPVGALCENVDECLGAINPCGDGACTDNAGSYVCTCPSGYRLAALPTITCVDIDECAEGSDFCTDAPPAATCANTVGDYVCTCPAGYAGSGRGAVGCSDVDECTLDTDDCDTDPLATCGNTIGSFTCVCPLGSGGTAHGPAGCDGPRFTDLGNRTVRDNTTNLIWQQDFSALGLGQMASRTYCANLALAGGGWRLPTRDELLSIVDTRSAPPAIDLTFFPGTPSAGFWSTSPFAGSPSEGWSVNFTMGIAYSIVVVNLDKARCVR